MELIELIDCQTTLLSWLTFLPSFQTDSQSPALLDLFLSSNASIGSTMAFFFSIDFPSYSQQDALFNCIACDYSRADWDGLCDHLRDALWEDIFKLGASAAAREYCEWDQVG